MYIWASFAVPNLKMPSDQVAISTQSPPSSGSLWNLGVTWSEGISQ